MLRNSMHRTTMPGQFGDNQRPTSSGNKVISLVPDHEPWKSPSLDYSKNVYLTSNPDDYDPQKIIMKLERNKLVHENFDVHLVT